MRLYESYNGAGVTIELVETMIITRMLTWVEIYLQKDYLIADII